MKTLNVPILICVLCLAATAWPSTALAQNVPFKVYITELWQLDADHDPVVGAIGDYYAKVTINNVEQNNEGACDDESFTGILVPYQLFKNFSRDPACGARTPWPFVRQVPAVQNSPYRKPRRRGERQHPRDLARLNLDALGRSHRTCHRRPTLFMISLVRRWSW